jgi:hypothetical protein
MEVGLHTADMETSAYCALVQRITGVLIIVCLELLLSPIETHADEKPPVAHYDLRAEGWTKFPPIGVPYQLQVSYHVPPIEASLVVECSRDGVCGTSDTARLVAFIAPDSNSIDDTLTFGMPPLYDYSDYKYNFTIDVEKQSLIQQVILETYTTYATLKGHSVNGVKRHLDIQRTRKLFGPDDRKKYDDYVNQLYLWFDLYDQAASNSKNGSNIQVMDRRQLESILINVTSYDLAKTRLEGIPGRRFDTNYARKLDQTNNATYHYKGSASREHRMKNEVWLTAGISSIATPYDDGEYLIPGATVGFNFVIFNRYDISDPRPPSLTISATIGLLFPFTTNGTRVSPLITGISASPHAGFSFTFPRLMPWLQLDVPTITTFYVTDDNGQQNVRIGYGFGVSVRLDVINWLSSSSGAVSGVLNLIGVK